ncbi:MAG: sugar ABC transporter permease [Anaerolineae bacterium]|nr:sugar ABC transporter permease [Anaerolineae bacterium]
MAIEQTAPTGIGEVAAAKPAAPTAATRPLSRRSRVEMVLFLLPAFIFQLVWGWYPLVVAFVLSFTNARVRGPLSFTGLESYLRMANDPLVARAFQVTITYAVMSIVLTFVIPILVAIFLMEMPPRRMRWMMLLWFLPLSSIASTILWRYIYNAQYGLMQYIATHILGLPPQRFLNDPSQVLFWLIFPGILLFGPGLIYMAALQGIPASYYEAAEVEGASFWRKIWTISLPRLRPVISMLLTFAIIGTLQEFTWPQIMTGGEPGGASRTVVMYMYSIWGNLRFADATALAIMLFALIMAITIVYRTFFKEDPDV